MTKLENVNRDKNGRIPQIWTVEAAVNESKKYKTKKDFRKSASSAYQYLVRHKKTHLVFLPGKRHRLALWDIFCSLKKSKTWGEFRSNYPKEYTAFHKKKSYIHESAYLHLGVQKTAKKWTEESIINEAKKYEHKSHFSQKSSGAYDAAINCGILQIACAHMKPLQSDFDCVYMWIAKKSGKETLVKFGVTSKRLGITRIKFVENKSGYTAKEIIIAEHSNALLIEETLKSIGRSANLIGFSGASEFFWLTESQINQAKEVINNEAIK